MQHPVQLLQPQVRLQQRVASRSDQRGPHPAAGGGEDPHREGEDPRAQRHRHSRTRRPARERGDLRGPRADRQGVPGTDPVHLHQRPGPPRLRPEAVLPGRQVRHRNHERPGPRDWIEDLRLRALRRKEAHRRGGRGKAPRAPDRGHTHVRGHGYGREGEHRHGPRDQRCGDPRPGEGGQRPRRIHSQHPAADPRGRDEVRRHACPHPAGTQEAHGPVRARRKDDAPLQAVQGRCHRAPGRGPLTGVRPHRLRPGERMRVHVHGGHHPRDRGSREDRGRI